MKKYTTPQANEYQVTFASSLPAGYGHRTITVEVVSGGEKGLFNATTSNMPGYDDASDLEGQEKYEALHELVESSIADQVDEFIETIKGATNP